MTSVKILVQITLGVFNATAVTVIHDLIIFSLFFTNSQPTYQGWNATDFQHTSGRVRLGKCWNAAACFGWRRPQWWLLPIATKACGMHTALALPNHQL